jgi:hypothetical protein
MKLAVWGDLVATQTSVPARLRQRVLDHGGERWRSFFNPHDWIPQPRARARLKNALPCATVSAAREQAGCELRAVGQITPSSRG